MIFNNESPVLGFYLREKTYDTRVAKAALEDRKPGKLFTAEAHPEGYNFVRHYVLSDGEVIGDNFGSLGSREYELIEVE